MTLLFPQNRLPYLLALIGFTMLLGSCKKESDPTSQSTITLKSDAKLGNFLIDKQGRTLYYFGLDVAGTSTCTSGCTDVWPIFYEDNVQVGPGLNAADFTTVKTASGQNQTFYKGWPLYYYATSVNGKWVQEPAGATGGEGLGNDWFVVRPDYTMLLATSLVLDKTTNQTGSYVYMIDQKGHTLYTYGKDARLPASQPTNCQGNCVADFPVFYQSTIVVPSTMKASDFGTITRTDGPNGSTRLQTTYKGQPLYYCTADNSVPGKITSQGGSSTSNTSDTWSVALP